MRIRDAYYEEDIDIEIEYASENWAWETLSPKSCWIEEYESHTAVCNLSNGGCCGTATAIYLNVERGENKFSQRFLISKSGNTSSQYVGGLRNASIDREALDFVEKYEWKFPRVQTNCAHTRAEKKWAEGREEREDEEESNNRAKEIIKIFSFACRKMGNFGKKFYAEKTARKLILKILRDRIDYPQPEKRLVEEEISKISSIPPNWKKLLLLAFRRRGYNMEGYKFPSSI